MIEVLNHLGQYVPTISTDREAYVEQTAETLKIKEDVFHPIALGMDEV